MSGAERRAGIFLDDTSTANIEAVKGLLNDENPFSKLFLGHLKNSIDGLEDTEIARELVAIVTETEALVTAVKLEGDRSPQGQAAALAGRGQYHATEATVAAFSDRLNPGEGEGFIAIAHLVTALQHGFGSSGSSTSEGADHFHAGIIHFSGAITDRAAASHEGLDAGTPT